MIECDRKTRASTHTQVLNANHNVHHPSRWTSPSAAFRLYVTSRLCWQADLVQKYGKWAVVSGGAGGIGRAMARELARRGMSLIIIDIDQRRLAETKRLLESEPSVGQVEVIQADLADPTPANFEKLRAQLEPDSRDIGVLVNNVATFPSVQARFNEHEIEETIAMLNLNVQALLRLTRMIMPGMLQRKRGLVLNVSALAGSVPGPLTQIYAASKAFVDSFTRQLQAEYSSESVDVVLLKPGPVHTLGASEQAGESAYVPSADAYAGSAITALSSGINSYAGTMLHELTNMCLPILSDLSGLLRLQSLVESLVANGADERSRQIELKEHLEQAQQDGATITIETPS
jgi:17beta-estradiol 17-dehydrogenase / very-long-chain 3-oxoacyl-CoA reductase